MCVSQSLYSFFLISLHTPNQISLQCNRANLEKVGGGLQTMIITWDWLWWRRLWKGLGGVCDTIRCEEGRKADMWLRQASYAIAPAVQCNAITLAIQCNTENSSSVYCVHNMCFHCTMALQHWYVMGVLAEPGSTRQPSPLHSAYLRVTICCPVRDCCYFFVLLEHLCSFVHSPICLLQSWNPVEILK